MTWWGSSIRSSHIFPCANCMLKRWRIGSKHAIDKRGLHSLHCNRVSKRMAAALNNSNSDHFGSSTSSSEIGKAENGNSNKSNFASSHGHRRRDNQMHTIHRKQRRMLLRRQRRHRHQRVRRNQWSRNTNAYYVAATDILCVHARSSWECRLSTSLLLGVQSSGVEMPKLRTHAIPVVSDIRHHSLLHGKRLAHAMTSSSSVINACNIQTELISSSSQVWLATAVVTVLVVSGASHSLRALIDQVSEASFITESAMIAMQLPIKHYKSPHAVLAFRTAMRNTLRRPQFNRITIARSWTWTRLWTNSRLWNRWKTQAANEQRAMV